MVVKRYQMGAIAFRVTGTRVSMEKFEKSFVCKLGQLLAVVPPRFPCSALLFPLSRVLTSLLYSHGDHADDIATASSREPLRSGNSFFLLQYTSRHCLVELPL